MYIKYKCDGRVSILNTDVISRFWISDDFRDAEFLPCVVYTAYGDNHMFIRGNDIEDCNNIIGIIHNIIAGKSKMPPVFEEDINLVNMTVTRYDGVEGHLIYPRDFPSILLDSISIKYKEKDKGYVLMLTSRKGREIVLSDLCSAHSTVEKMYKMFESAIKNGDDSFTFHNLIQYCRH